MRWPWQRKALPRDADRRPYVTVTPVAPPLFVEGVGGYAEMVKRSPSVAVAVRAIVDSAVQPEIAVLQQGRDGRRFAQASSAALPRLLREPSPGTPGLTWRSGIYEDLLTAGVHVSVLHRDGRGRATAAVRVDPARVSRVSAFDTDDERDRVRVETASGAKEFPLSDCLVIQRFAHGGSPLEPLRGVLEQEQRSIEFRRNYWANAARLEFAIQRPLEAPPWSDDARERFRKDLEATYAGADNSGRIGVLEESMDIKELSFSPRDSEFVEGSQAMTRMVCAALGVPLALLDVSGGRNAGQARRNLIMDTILPMARRVDAALDQALVPAVYGDQAGNARIVCRTDWTSQLEGDWDLLSEVGARSTGGPFETVNEFRARLDLPPVEGGDRLREPLSVPLAGPAVVTQPED